MNQVMIPWALTALATALLLGLWKRVGIKDIPNHRSTHVDTTPTAAGACISLIFLSFCLANHLKILTLTPIPLAFGLGLSILTVVGLIDDWQELNYKTRLISHALAVGLVLSWQTLTHAEYLIWFFIGVGLINACNFLDGLNGLLASQWLLTTGFLLAGFANPDNMFWILWICVLVYLFFNFPKARLFMGDTGSTILGFAYFAIVFYLSTQNNELPRLWLGKDSFVLFALFPLGFAWGDVAFTLMRRFVEKRSVVASFGDYGFHHQAKFFKSHGLVTLSYLSLNCLLAYGAQVLFFDHQLIYVVCSGYIFLQILHMIFVYKISKK